MKFLQFVTLSILAAAHCTATPRIWTDNQNREMQAELIRVEQGVAIFKKADAMHYRVPLETLSAADQTYIAELNHAQSAADTQLNTATPPSGAMSDFEHTITKYLVHNSGKRLKKVNRDALHSKDFYAIYYSAHWCPPCRKFTPELVNFYQKHRKKHTNFEIIFVSSDNDEDSMAEYMQESNMEWPALDYDKRDKAPELTRYAGNGIPCLVLIDNAGNVLADSYVDGQYVGPTTVMRTLGEKLAGE
jgi:nucleoredoxin